MWLTLAYYDPISIRQGEKANLYFSGMPPVILKTSRRVDDAALALSSKTQGGHKDRQRETYASFLFYAVNGVPSKKTAEKEIIYGLEALSRPIIEVWVLVTLLLYVITLGVGLVVIRVLAARKGYLELSGERCILNRWLGEKSREKECEEIIAGVALTALKSDDVYYLTATGSRPRMRLDASVPLSSFERLV